VVTAKTPSEYINGYVIVLIYYCWGRLKVNKLAVLNISLIGISFSITKLTELSSFGTVKILFILIAF